MEELIPLLKTEEYLRKSQLQIKKIRDSDLIIIDDLMYMAMDQNEANLFFHLVNHLYIILTSNKGTKGLRNGESYWETRVSPRRS